MDGNQSLTKPERRRLKKDQEQREAKKAINKWRIKKIAKIFIWIIFISAVLVGLIYITALDKTLPPTSIVGHIEESPSSHILTEPMPYKVQQHMLEHADGSGQPGVVINYNCEDYQCEPDLIEKLTNLAKEYPEYVYLAPFPKMDAKIAVTRIGKIITLDNYEEQKIKDFIVNK